jgi:predicted PP-loop superfamily ATPase
MRCIALQDYKAAQKVAAEREAQYLPKVPPAAAAASASSAAAAAAGTSEADIESQALLQEQVQQESRAMENTISFQEALIEERDQGIAGGLVLEHFCGRCIAGSHRTGQACVFGRLEHGNALVVVHM